MSTLKCLDNGYLICNDLETWDLLLLDRNLNEIQRLKGSGHEVPGNRDCFVFFIFPLYGLSHLLIKIIEIVN